MKQKTLSISVIIPTYNSSRTIELTLKSLDMQDFPKNLIEIIIVDGGSKDATLEIVKKYPVIVINVSSKKQNAEYNKGVGVNKAKNDILLLIDHDNVLPHKKWFQNMLKPFLEHREVVGVEPLRFHYDKSMTPLDRYFALIGGTDPVPYYLKKNSHLSWAFDRYNLIGNPVDKGKYYIVKFTPDEIPALGGNGAAIRRKLLLSEANSDPENFFHIDVQVDLIRKGYNTYAFTKDSIIHLTNNKLFPFLSRRKYFIEKYYFKDQEKRRYSVFQGKKDLPLLIYYLFISLTIIKPTYDALRGYVKINDPAWFIHPLMCFAMVFVYGIPTLKEEIHHVAIKR